jgi:hypothetical protein
MKMKNNFPIENEKMKINKHNFEINKPSELCQVVFFENYKKGIFAYLTPTQIDLINILFYQVKKEILTDKTSTDDLDSIIMVDIELTEIHRMLNYKYNKDSEALLNYLYELKKVDVMVNTLGKVKDRIDYKLTSIIHTLEWSKHKNILDKKIKIGIDRDIILSFIDRKDYFAKMHLSLQLSMVSKYSKLLYEILKDYAGLKTITVDFGILLPLLNVNFENTRNGEWSMFNQNILMKSVNEINEKSDIVVSYEAIKEKPEGGRLQVTKIKFTIEKQPEIRLCELGLIPPRIDNNKFYNKSKTKLDKLISSGYKVIDEEKWIETDITNNEERYDAEMRVDMWLKSTPREDRNKIYELLATNLDECHEQFITIEGYLIKGIFSNEAYTKNPMETIAVMNDFLSKIT